MSKKTECKRSPDNPQRRRICISCGRWFTKIIRRDYEFQEPTLRRESTVKRERESQRNLKAIGKSFNLKKQKMTKKSQRTFGLFNDTSFLVFKLNRLKYIDVIRSTHTDLDVHKKYELMTIGMSTEAEICQIHGRVSQDLHY